MGEARPIPGEYEGRPEPYPYDPEYPDRPESPYDDDRSFLRVKIILFYKFNNFEFKIKLLIKQLIISLII